MYRKKALLLTCILTIAVLLIGCGAETPKEDEKAEKTKNESVKTIKVSYAGDLVIHDVVYDTLEPAGAEKRDYYPCFRFLEKHLKKADIAICTFEGTLSGPPFAGYPLFRNPDGLPEGLKQAGFDVVNIASNHTADGMENGFKRTLEQFNNAGMKMAGVRMESSGPRYAMMEKDGIKVAFVNYTYATGDRNNRALNGIPMTEYENQRVNSFNPDDLDGALEDVGSTVKAARKAGADIVITYFHWGDEYHTTANEWQNQLAQRIADETSTDIIMGSHPHVNQEFKMLKSKKDNRQVPCYFAIGNLLSNQRRELVYDLPEVEQGVLVNFDIAYDKKAREIKSIDRTHIPYWVDKYEDNGTKFAIVPLDEDFETNPVLMKSGHLPLAQAAYKSVFQILNIEEER